MNVINRFNIWFNSLKEPKRFFVFIIFMSLAIFPLQFGFYFSNKFLMFFGFIIIFIMNTIAVIRASLGRKHKIVGIMMLFFMILIFIGIFK